MNMTNPFQARAPFYEKSWMELHQQLPGATEVQRYHAAERLRLELDALFHKRVRELALEYEEDRSFARERHFQEQARLESISAPDEL